MNLWNETYSADWAVASVKTLGIDVSKYQGAMDFAKAQAAGWLQASFVVKIALPVIPPVIPPVDPPPEPEPEPPPEAGTKTYTVTAAKTLARFIHDYNEAGKPIFQIYPGDSITTGRFRFDTGVKITVWPTAVRGDGGGDYYLMEKSPVATALYLNAADGALS